jgi:hypothetical protein
MVGMARNAPFPTLTISQTKLTGGTTTAFRFVPTPPHLHTETKMKFALIGIGFAAAAAFATPALAQAVIEDPGYCAQFYPNANCENLGPGNPYTDGGYYRDQRNGNAMMPNHARIRPDGYAEPDRYHGGPKEDE